MQVTINGTTAIDPGSPVSVGGEYDITIGWNPTSSLVGLGRSPLGNEAGGFAGTVPVNLFYSYVEVKDTGGAVVYRSEAIWPNACEWTYPAVQNRADHGGTYQAALTFTVYQVNHVGVESDSPPSIQTTT